LPQSRRLRRDQYREKERPGRPPQDCRSRGDCGDTRKPTSVSRACRLKIAAVAATAAAFNSALMFCWLTASRLPQSRRLRLDLHPLHEAA